MTARAVLDAATPGLCICLIIGGLVYVLSPIILWISVGLAGASQGRQGGNPAGLHVRHRRCWPSSAFLGLLTVDTGFGDWWRFVGCAGDC